MTVSPAGADTAHAASSAWAAKRDITSSTAYSCTVSRQYNGFFNFSMTDRSGNGTTLAFDFENRSFSTGSQHPVRIYADNGASRVFEGMAESATRITVDLGRDSEILSALEGQNVLKADIGDRFRALNVYSISPGLKKLNACMALPLDDPGHGLLGPPSAPGNQAAAQQRSSLVKVQSAEPDIAAPVPAAEPAPRPAGDEMTSRIAGLMEATEPAPPPSSDLRAPVPSTRQEQAATGDPYNSSIHDRVKQLSGIASAPPKPLLEPAPEPVGTLEPVEPRPQQSRQQQAQPKPQPPAPVEAAPLTPARQRPPPVQPAPDTQKAPPAPDHGPVPTPEPAPAQPVVKQAQQTPAPDMTPAPDKPAPQQSQAPQPTQDTPASRPEEPPREIAWAHKRVMPDPPEFILEARKKRMTEARQGVMLADTRDDVHKPLSMPPELRAKKEQPPAVEDTQPQPKTQAQTQPPAQPSQPAPAPQTGDDMPWQAAMGEDLTLTPDFAGDETAGTDSAAPGDDEVSMEDILNEPIEPQPRADTDPVEEEPVEPLPGVANPSTPSEFVKEMEVDDTLLAQAQKVDQARMNAENTSMEMVSSLLEKMRLLEIEKESLRKELATYQTGPVSEIARIESQARKIYALKTRLERLGNANAQLQKQLKFAKDRVSDLEQLNTELQLQADEAAQLRERVNAMTEQNEALREQVTDLEKEVKQARLLRDEDRRRLDELRDIIGSMSSKLDGLSGNGLFGDQNGGNQNGGGNTGETGNGDGTGDGQDNSGQGNSGQDSGRNDGQDAPSPQQPQGNTGNEIETIDPADFEEFLDQ